MTLDPLVAIADVARFDSDALIVSTCGYTSRDLYAVADRPSNLYLLGSMGVAAAVALGVAIACGSRRVIAIDGDGSFAMGLGVLSMVADQRPRLVHVVLDNAVHESTGGQPTVVPVDIAGVARAAGYASARTASTRTELALALAAPMPSLVHVPVERRIAPAPRVDLTPCRIVARFRSELVGA